MKTKLLTKYFTLLIFILSGTQLLANSTKTVGSSGADYSTLKAAFDKVNDGTLSGIVILQIIDNTTESASAILNASGTGSAIYSSIKIYPTVTGKTISGNLALPVIDLNGVNNVTIDGRLNGSGSTYDLTIVNSNTSGTSNTSTIRFINSAQNNTVKYCQIKGGATGVYSGIVLFAGSASGSGNNLNVIDNCSLTGLDATNRPSFGIYSYGTSGRENKNNTISNNNIFNFLSATLASSYGINISSFSTDWIVTGNSLYETTTFSPTGTPSYYGIKTANTSGNNFVITNNYIGGSGPHCSGAPWTINSNYAYRFYCIHIDAGTTIPSSIQGNVIKNFTFTGVSDIPWMGIDINSGNVNVGDISGNTIGESNSTGSITLTVPVASASSTVSGGAVTTIPVTYGGSGYTTPPVISFNGGGGTGAAATAVLTGGVVTSINVDNGGTGFTTAPTIKFNSSSSVSNSYGIYVVSPDNVIVSNNQIGSITTLGNASYSHGFTGISKQTVGGTTVINNNLIGSQTVAQSIRAGTSSGSSTAQNVYGIYSSGNGSVSVTNNIVSNLYNAFSYQYATNGQIVGITTGAGVNTIQNNIVNNLASTTPNNSTTYVAAVIGIVQKSTTPGQTVLNNTISNLSSTFIGGRDVCVIGIHNTNAASGVNVVSNNFIYGLNLSSTSITSSITGIKILSGNCTYANNIINLGNGISKGYSMFGIYDNCNPSDVIDLYFNSIYLNGSRTGTTSPTYAVFNNNNSSTRDFRNNILFNATSGGTTGEHYAIHLAGISNVTIGNNDYFVSGTGGMLGSIGPLDKATLAAWQLGTTQDVNSLNVNPGFTSAGGTSAINYYTSTSLPGVSGTGVVTDYDGITRGVTPKMGALEINNFVWQGSVSTDFGTAANWSNSIIPPDGANISFTASPSRNCVIDKNRVLANVTISQSTYKLILNGKQLSVIGNLIFTNGAQIDATAPSSVMVFNGSTAQSIPTGSFVSNTMDALAVNNPTGLTLNGDLTVQQSLTLTKGLFTIGSNTLTINGSIAATSGTIIGGSSTNLILGGSGATTILPAISLNSLTINRTSGISMGGSVNVAGSLILTAGVLSLGANTLMVSGTLTRTGGSIDASNTNATLTFANPTALTLPVSLFLSSINNLNITGVGGLTSAGDMTVNGALNLQNSNVSATKGILDMWDETSIKTLTMGANATTTGLGDVTGIVKRNSFVAATNYSFGNQFTTMTFAASGTLPTDISVKITIGTATALKSSSVKRIYDIIRTSGTGTFVTLSLHYLDSELQANAENNLVVWDYHVGTPNIEEEHGKANQSTTDNWVAISNRPIDYFASTFDLHTWGLSNKESADFLWEGTPSSDWNDPNNWSGGVIPINTSDVIIPDASTTVHSPLLPSSNSAIVNTLTIQAGGILNGGAATTLTIAGSSGAWLNLGTFNPGTSTIVFTNANATMADPTNFYNVTIEDGAGLTPGTNNIMRIAGILMLQGTGILRAALLPNTIEFNGSDQTVINPNGLTPGFYNLILSGTGTKGLPGSALSIAGDLTTSGTAIVQTIAAVNIEGSLNLGSGTTFNAGNYTHSIGGDFNNNGTFNTSTGSTITMNGSAAQSIIGNSNTNFDILQIMNSYGVTLLTGSTVNNNLTLTNGNLNVGAVTLGINGTISRTNGLINLSPLSSMSFGGSNSITLPNNLFTSAPSLNNLIINRSGGVSLGNQPFTVNGELDLTSGTLTVGANMMTLAGSSPTRVSGTMNVSNANSTIVFNNSSPIILPASIFNGNVSNMTINGLGGVSSNGDFEIDAVLNLQSANPSDFKGSLDMWDGTVMKTLTMGGNGTTIGPGDATGIITRTNLLPGMIYTYGNQFTTVYFPNVGTLPTAMTAKISIGKAPSWKPGAINRELEIIQTGGSGTKAQFQYHFLDSELNGNLEDELVFWVKMNNLEYGRSSNNLVNEWINLSNVDVAFFSSSWDGTKNITLANYSTTSNLTWNGSLSNSWTSVENWTPNVGPSSDKNIIIPDASITVNSPMLPAITEIQSLNINGGGVLNSSALAQLTINGTNAWMNNGGTFNANTSTVIFTNAAATIDGTTNFYNMTVETGKDLSLQTGSVLRIAGTLTNNGTFHTINNGGITTVEYNGGNQTVVVPNVSTNKYSNLILSGIGTKTMPGTVLEIQGDFTTSGTSTINTGASLTMDGNVSIGTGSTFNGGNYSHSIVGNLVNNGSIATSSGGLMTFNGTLLQSISGIGATSFYDLTISNSGSGGVKLLNDVTTTHLLTINSGSSLTISPIAAMNVAGTISNIAGTTGLIIKSDPLLASGTLIFHNATGSPVPATVEMYSIASWNLLNPVGGKYKWQFVGIPVQSVVASPTFNGAYVRWWDETTSNWIQLQNANTLNSFTGYEITQSDAKMYYLQGPLENSDFYKPLIYTTGVNNPGQYIFGNPYTAAIDIKQINFTGDADATVYLYNTGSHQDWYDNSQVSETGSNPGQYLSVPKSSAGTMGIPRQIASMQGFLVKMNSPYGTSGFGISYNGMAIVKDTTKQRVKAFTETLPATNICTRIDVKGTRFSDCMWIITDPACSHHFDNGWDGEKFLGSPLTPQLYAMESEGDYQVDAVDDINKTDLGFQAGEDSNYTLTFTHENVASRYQSLYLIDLQENTTMDITPSGTTYSFKAISTPTPVKRFTIVTSPEVVTDILKLSTELKIFNSKQTIFVQNSSQSEGILTLYDISGRLVFQGTFKPEGLSTIQTNLPSGSYVAKGIINTSGQMITAVINLTN